MLNMLRTVHTRTAMFSFASEIRDRKIFVRKGSVRGINTEFYCYSLTLPTVLVTTPAYANSTLPKLECLIAKMAEFGRIAVDEGMREKKEYLLMGIIEIVCWQLWYLTFGRVSVFDRSIAV